MTRRHLLVAAACAVVLRAGGLTRLAAHDGHDHKVLGVLTAISSSQLSVKGADGAVSRVALTPATKITRGGAAIAAADLAAGDRVVVNVGNGKTPLTAKAVQVGVRETRK
jgi:hypothetical protein